MAIYKWNHMFTLKFRLCYITYSEGCSINKLFTLIKTKLDIGNERISIFLVKRTITGLFWSNDTVFYIDFEKMKCPFISILTGLNRRGFINERRHSLVIYKIPVRGMSSSDHLDKIKSRIHSCSVSSNIKCNFFLLSNIIYWTES